MSQHIFYLQVPLRKTRISETSERLFPEKNFIALNSTKAKAEHQLTIPPEKRAYCDIACAKCGCEAGGKIRFH